MLQEKTSSVQNMTVVLMTAANAQKHDMNTDVRGLSGSKANTQFPMSKGNLMAAIVTEQFMRT